MGVTLFQTAIPYRFKISIMRIGIDATSLPASLAGAGRYIRGLITGLAATNSDHEYIVFIKKTDRPRFQHISCTNITFIEIPYLNRPARLYWEYFQTSQVIGQHKLDVWHAPHYIVPRSAGNCKIVVTFHDMVFYIFPDLYSWVKRTTFQWALPHAVRMSDHIIATSEATKNEIVHILQAQKNKITVIHSGIDEAFRPIDDAQLLDQVKIRYGITAPYILAVGTLDRRKNLQTLIQAFHTLIQDKDPGCSLVIVGQKGNGHLELVREIAQRNIEHRIHLLGYVEEADLPILYSGARLFVSSSRYEGYGFPALEALACGTPILSSPSPSILETTTRAGLVVEPINVRAWYERLDDALKRAPQTGQYLENMDHYAWRHVAGQTVHIYEEAAGRSGHSVSIRKQAIKHETQVPDACSFAVLKTIVYADLFDYPLTIDEIHQNLYGFRASRSMVAAAIKTSELTDLITSEQGYYMLKNRPRLYEARLRKTGDAQQLFERHHHLLYWLCACPFVSMTALSGALAFKNCTEDSDIDLFLVVEKKRLWTVYACMAVIAKLIGQRKRLCLNYIIGQSDTHINDHDFFTAHQIANLRPIYGWSHYRRFTATNGWVMGYLPQWNGHGDGTHTFPGIKLSRWAFWGKRVVEWTGSLPLFNPLEWLIFKLYKKRIEQTISPSQADGVYLTIDRIKLHTNDHSHRVLKEFEDRIAETMEQHERMHLIAQESHSAHNGHMTMQIHASTKDPL
jgi:glycosyltransferase involved in cell wall biosynthesis